MRLAELCAGYGGLHLAIDKIVNASIALAWYAETDPHAASVMAHNHPRVKNVGDITTADWSAVGPVDVLAGGIPCQPWSASGKRRGSSDSRDLWPVRKHHVPRRGMLDAIRALTPTAVVIENVPGLLVGDDGTAFATILSDLCQVGYTVRWTTLGACAIGMCHHRHRVFIIATRDVGDIPYDSIGMPLGAWSAWPSDGVCANGLVWSQPSETCGGTGETALPTPTATDGQAGAGRGTRRDGRCGVPNLRSAVTLFPTPCASDGGSRGTGLGTYPSHEGRPLREVVAMLPTPTGSDGQGGAGHNGRCGAPNLRTVAADFPTPGQWGRWETAVGRHADVVGRPAPPPTIVGTRGGIRLNPLLTEWMMGLPVGWITDALDNANACNKIAGNGVVPDQAAAAIRLLLRRGGLSLG